MSRDKRLQHVAAETAFRTLTVGTQLFPPDVGSYQDRAKNRGQHNTTKHEAKSAVNFTMTQVNPDSFNL